MKVMLNTAKVSVFGQSQISQKQKSNPINQNKNSMELAGFNSVGRSLVTFKGDGDNGIKLTEKNTQELEELKKLYLSNQEEIDKKKKAAQENIDKIEAWNYTNEYNKQKLEAENEIDRENLSRFWNPFKCNAIREKHYIDFHIKDVEINNLRIRRDVDQTIIDSSPLSSSQVKSLVEQIDAMIAQKLQIEKDAIWKEGIEGVNEAFGSMKNTKGGLDDRIAGYNYAKDELRRFFVEPLAQSKNDKSIAIPSCIMLHGARGTGKTEMIKAIGTEAKAGDYAKIVEIDTLNLSLKEFKKELGDEMEKARSRYSNTGQRTVILVNEIQKYLAFTTPEEAMAEYKDLIDEKDIKSIRDYATDAGFINDMKSRLDNCSGIPDSYGDKSGKCATTLFITTNYPHLIDRDILRKIDHYIAVNPAKDDDLIAVVSHYAKRSAEVVKKIKILASNPDFKPEYIDRLHLGLSKAATQNLKKMAQEKRMNELDINVEKMDFSQIPTDFNPTMKKGAFNNKQIMQAATIALNKYLEDPSSEFDSYLWQALFNIPRDITPASHKKFVAIYNELAPLCDRENNGNISKDEEEMLSIMAKSGKLTGKFKTKWEYIQKRNVSELKKLENLEETGKLSEVQKKRLDELRGTETEKNNEDEWQ